MQILAINSMLPECNRLLDSLLKPDYFKRLQISNYEYEHYDLDEL